MIEVESKLEPKDSKIIRTGNRSSKMLHNSVESLDKTIRLQPSSGSSQQLNNKSNSSQQNKLNRKRKGRRRPQVDGQLRNRQTTSRLININNNYFKPNRVIPFLSLLFLFLLIVAEFSSPIVIHSLAHNELREEGKINDHSLRHYLDVRSLLLDDESDSPSGQSSGGSSDDSSATQSSSSSDSDNYTNNDHHVPFQTTTTAAPTTTTATYFEGYRRPPTRPKKTFRATESDLLPFSDFTVQQPTFSDLMKSWPPTTTAAHHRQQPPPPQESALRRQQSPYPARAGSQRSQPLDVSSFGLFVQQNNDQSEMRNHLNEDLDDTIVTADQDFERDQVAEPPTWINYLGEMGDCIYTQLRLLSPVAELSTEPPTSGGHADDAFGDDSHKQQPATKTKNQLKLEIIDELLDDHYYDQYENSQVLYYGPQLVREGDTLEIGCYMPHEQKAKWTKSGRPLVVSGSTMATGNRSSVQHFGSSSSPRVIRKSDFLGAKQNYSLKIFEASLEDSGNYRCNKMSRKYHKLVVVPSKISTGQLYLAQQRLLSVVNPKLLSAPQFATGSSRFGHSPQLLQQQINQRLGGSSSLAPGNKIGQQQQQSNNNNNKSSNNNGKRSAGDLLPGHLIVEGQPLVVVCNISDEFVLRRLRENPQFQLAWFKNGRQMRNSMARDSSLGAHNLGGLVLPSAAGSGNQSPAAGQQQQKVALARSRLQQQQNQQLATQSHGRAAQRVQFSQPNGRQMVITAAQYSDAGEYLCSWSKLPIRSQPQSGDPMEEIGGLSLDASGGGAGTGSSDELSGQLQQQPSPTLSSNPLLAGSRFELLAPVKLRPFKSAYYVRAGNEIRLLCQVQRGYPAAHISWYVGNRLVDDDFLRESAPGEFRVLQLSSGGQVLASSSSGGGNNDQPPPPTGSDQKKIVEINPVPLSKQQLSLTANGQWIEYKDPRNERNSIDTPEQQLRYLQQKLVQLTGLAGDQQAAAAAAGSGAQIGISGQSAGDSGLLPPAPQAGARASDSPASGHLSTQSSLSMLVIKPLDISVSGQVKGHTSRYACRATTRSNTDEVTTVIRVQATSTRLVKPTSGKATLIPGQPLHFQCEMEGNRNANYRWYKKPIDGSSSTETPLDPDDDSYEMHNEKLTIPKPNLSFAGDYACRALKEDDRLSVNNKEFAIIRLRAQPYIEDFGRETSHTGKSSTITDGDKLELTCTVRDKITPVNITWLRSTLPDDERTMTELTETPGGGSSSNGGGATTTTLDPYDPTYLVSEQNIIIKEIDNHTKTLTIESVKPEHRGYYVCMVDNGVTERSRKVLFIRVKDKLVALWPFLGIIAQLFILFTIIYVWETQKAYREVSASTKAGATASKRPTSGPSAAVENAPLM